MYLFASCSRRARCRTEQGFAPASEAETLEVLPPRSGRRGRMRKGERVDAAAREVDAAAREVDAAARVACAMWMQQHERWFTKELSRNRLLSLSSTRGVYRHRLHQGISAQRTGVAKTWDVFGGLIFGSPIEIGCRPLPNLEFPGSCSLHALPTPRSTDTSIVFLGSWRGVVVFRVYDFH